MTKARGQARLADRARLITVAMAAVLVAASPAQTAPIRSDLPLWATGGAAVWPKTYADGAGFNVVSNIGVGDWHLRRVDCESEEADECSTWLRLGFVSLFDGGFVVTEARTREGLDTAVGEHAYLVVLPGVAADGSKLLALQIGFMGGSRYMLLRGRAPDMHDRLDILDGACDNAGALAWLSHGYRQRRSPTRGYFRTDYCAVRSAKGLVNLAGEAPASEQTMEYIGPAPRKDAEADGPSAE